MIYDRKKVVVANTNRLDTTVVAAVFGDAKGLNNNPSQHNLLLEFLIEFSNLCHIHFEAELELFWLGSNFL